MIIKNEKPPVWDSACAAFQINPHNTVFTYGDVIYNPSGRTVGEDVIEHEKIHMAQQGHTEAGAELWWGRYLREPEFRLDQEARAYGRQYQYLCTQFKDRNRRTRILFDIGRILSGPLYGKCVDFNQAMELIKKYAV